MRGKIRISIILLAATIVSQFLAVMLVFLPSVEASHGTAATTPSNYNNPGIYGLVNDATKLSAEASAFTDCDSIKPDFEFHTVFIKSLQDKNYKSKPESGYTAALQNCLEDSAARILTEYQADLDSFTKHLIIRKVLDNFSIGGIGSIDTEFAKLLDEYYTFDLPLQSSKINLEISRIYKLLVIVENNPSRIDGGVNDWVVNLTMPFTIPKITNLSKLIDDIVKQSTSEPTAEGFAKILTMYDSAPRENEEKLHFSVDYYGSLRTLMSEMQAATASVKPCGVKTGGVGDMGEALRAVLCNITIMVHDWATRFLKEAASLLSYTSDMINRPSSGEGGLISGFIFSGDLSNVIKIPIESELVNQKKTSFGPLIREAYSSVLRLLNIVLILALLLLGLTNILQIQINTYAIKKALPGLLIGFLIAQGSFFFVRITLEVTGQATRGLLSVGRPTSNFKDFVTAFSGFPSGLKDIVQCDLTKSYMTIDDCKETNAVDMIKVFRVSLLNLFMLVASIMLFILGFLLLIRRFIFYALVPLAPLALLGLFFGPLNFIWNRWWKLYSGWLFMPLAAGFWVWLAMVWFSAVGKTSPGAVAAPMLGYVFGVIALYLAIKTPFSMAGEAKVVMDKWNNLGKNTISGKNLVGKQVKNAALTYTPAGAMVRGYNKFAALQKAKEKEILEGDIVKNKWARSAGGNTINRFMKRKELSQQQKEEDQKNESEKIEAQAKNQLQSGIFKNATMALAARKNLKAVGLVLEGFVDTVDRIAQRVDVLSVRKSFNYAAKQEEIQARKLDTQQLTATSTFESQRRFVQGGAMHQDEIRYKELVDEFHADPTAFKEDKRLELKSLARKIGAENKADPIISRLVDANDHQGVYDNRYSKLFRDRKEAIDRVATLRRGQSAEIKGLDKAKELVLSWSEDDYAAENTHNVGMDKEIEKLLYDTTLQYDFRRRDELFKVLKSRSRTSPELNKVMEAFGVSSSNDLRYRSPQAQQLRTYLTRVKIERADNRIIHESIDRELGKRISGSISEKQRDWKDGYSADEGIKANQQEVATAVLAGTTTSLDMSKNTVRDIVDVEKKIGALYLGLRDDDTITPNIKALLDDSPSGNIYPVLLALSQSGLSGILDLNKLEHALETPGTSRDEINGLKRAFYASDIGKNMQRVTGSPSAVLSTSPYSRP